MSNLTRFGVSIEESLLENFDALVSSRGYANRSEAIRDLIRDELVQQQLESSTTGSIGTITIIYDHHVKVLSDVLNSVQHQHNEQIVSTTHVHLDHHNCLEVIIVRGEAGIIKDIAHKLISLKGVKHGKLVMTTTE
ncbi:MAG: nickel-responsive transcriptional regulator NikR [candidate division KSB1 bacterium]|jgi:CopG family nickel-responsive transcriptional regulator|nr:nickel-responsive transcriptional regulator NikR [candidate division KSB1 bacterium]